MTTTATTVYVRRSYLITLKITFELEPVFVCVHAAAAAASGCQVRQDQNTPYPST